MLLLLLLLLLPPLLQGGPAQHWKGDAMLRKVHIMLQAVFRARGLKLRAQGEEDPGVPRGGLMEYAIYKEVYRQCQALFKRQAGTVLPDELDPQDNSLTATFNRDQLVKMADTLLSSQQPSDARDHSMLLSMSHTAGRGDDLRERRLCELTPPLLRTCIGEQFTFSPDGAQRTRATI